MKNEVNTAILRQDAKQCWDLATTVMTTASQTVLSLQISVDAFGILPPAQGLAAAYAAVDSRVWELTDGASLKFAGVATQLRTVATVYENTHSSNTTIITKTAGSD